VGWSSAFDPVEDGFWRIRHDESADDIVFETAPDVWGAPGPWRAHFRSPIEVPVNSMRVELKAGTSGPQTFLPGTAVFDNVRIGR
jgi:hypothetical protein